MIKVKSPRDFGAGLLFILIGLGGFWFGRNLNIGIASRMGPGYFPMMLSGLIAALGLLVMIKSFAIDGPEIEKPQLRPLFFIVLSMLAFGYLIERIGLAFSVAVMIIIATFARRAKFDIKETLLLAIGMGVFAVFVFIYGLGQTLPAWWGK